MPLPLFSDNDSNDSEPELIPRRERPSHEFSKPFEIRVGVLILIGAALLVWQLSLSDWRSSLSDVGQLLWLVALLPLAFLWWRLRRLGSKRRELSSRETGERSEIRLVADDEPASAEDVASWKLIAGMIAYVIAVLALMALALKRMLS